ncbi:MAG: hypothetical protein Q9201_000433 [Fulgogasparrea decipioides]
MNGRPAGNSQSKNPIDEWNKSLKAAQSDAKLRQTAEFHGDKLLADKQTKLTGLLSDMRKVLNLQNAPQVLKIAVKGLSGQGLDIPAGAKLVGSMSNNSGERSKLIQSQVQEKYDKMLHPPLTYLGDAFQYRAPDGKFNSVLHPHLGQAGAPYAKTVPSKTHPLGALPDPEDVFDRLMARNKGRNSESGLSSMLIYHATIIIHDIFRTNDSDKNISDASSYLDLSPLYGYTMEMQRKVRDDKFKLGLLKPDTFAEDKLLRQPPGVCIMLIMYNRYHNYAATQIKRINENGRFTVPTKFKKTKLLAIADSKECVPDKLPDGKPNRDDSFDEGVKKYEEAWNEWCDQGQKPLHDKDAKHTEAEKQMRTLLDQKGNRKEVKKFEKAHEAAWNKLDDDLFNTARLITCGMYVNISIHDYLRALMGFHQFNTNFTLDPRIAMTEHKNVSRGLGNQVTVEFNLLYRFHCAISQKDEEYTENLMKETMEEMAKKAAEKPQRANFPAATQSDCPPDPKSSPEPKSLSLMQFSELAKAMSAEPQKDPWLLEFGLKSSPTQSFKRNTITGLFDDQKMIDQLCKSMDDPISNFGPRNVPRALKNVEIMGILQARKWEIGTLNDFRDFFGLERHESFKNISGNEEIQDALRDLYDHPDKVELYPGIFCESFENMNGDPGPSGLDSALWSAIFSDAITLVRSDRFYTVDWNTNSLTSWGMKEVTPDNDTLKSSVFHRLLQRAFPEWYPYDSIRFFHPFYTSKQNAKFAIEQGYASTFNGFANGRFEIEPSEPQKPHKPLFLTSYDDIRKVLAVGADEIIHPAFTNCANLPQKVQEALQPIKTKSGTNDKSDSPENARITKAYFAHQMKAIIEREAITVDKNKPIYQVDITRDVAIPVVTRCIADFLGFGDQIKNVDNPKAKYSENEIYQHITNCQVFLSYNADETKLLKRRAAFKESMGFLLKLAEEGNIVEADRWGLSRTIRSFFKRTSTSDHDGECEPMKALGQSVAARILEEEWDTGKAAAILLLTALDVAYISVLAFTAVLDHLLRGAYDIANRPANSNEARTSDWLEIQQLALQDDEESDREIQLKLLEAQRQSVKLPFIRKAVKDGVEIRVNGQKHILKKGETIICDIYQAMQGLTDKELEDTHNYCHLNYISSLSKGLVHFNPKDVALHGLTAMIKVTAQMKNLRRGHTSQGYLKRIEIDQTYEGYANFMAPERMQMIANDVKFAATRLEQFQKEPHSDMPAEERKAKEMLLNQQKKDAKKVFNKDVLKPKADTYLTAEWDEMIPFPTTWKIRFDGYGASNYGKGLSMLKQDPPLDSFPPFYQPQGASHYGGSFGEGFGEVRKEMPADLEDVKMKGCGAPVPCLHSAPEGLDNQLH